MRICSKLVVVVAASLSMVFCVSSAFAQSTNAELSGRITDPNGLSVPKVRIQAVNVLTNVATSTETNEAGIYVISSLQPAIYRVLVEKEGFDLIVKPNVELHVQDHGVLNFQLRIGSVATTVTVEGGLSLVNTTDAAVSTVVDQTYVKNMPLNGRSFQDLILLTPGIVTLSPTRGGTGLGETGEFSVNGQRTEANNYTVDGVSANVGVPSDSTAMIVRGGASGSVPAATALGTTQALVSVDDLQEFRVQSSTYSAEYGRNPGGQLAFTTKSGTNQWHGTAYDYLRNDYFDANDWFNNYFGQKEPPLRQNDFGGTFGGPVRIPRFYNGKDKTFFFVSYEGLRLIQPQAASTSSVPDLCMRGVAGSCAGLIGPTGNPRMPAATALLPVVNAFPLPSPGGLEDTVNGVGQFIGIWSNPNSLNSTSVRLDHALNDRLKLFFRFSDTGSSSAHRFTGIAPPTMQNKTDYNLRTYTAGVSNIFSNRWSNDFRLNYSSNEVTGGDSFTAAFGGSTPVNLAQLTGLGLQSWPIVVFLLGNNVFFFDQAPSSVAQRQWNLVDAAGFSLGAHQFKFGVDYRRSAPRAVPPTPLAEYVYFDENSVEVNNPNTGSGLLAIEAFAPAYPVYTNFSAFSQDEWKISRRLNLSLGLRWEVNPPPGVSQGLMPYTIQGTNPSNWALAPQGTPLWHTTWYNFAPRLGAAYAVRNAPGWETVVRAGGGVFFDTGQQDGSIGFNGPGFTALSFPSSPFPGNPATQVPTIANPPVGKQQTIYGFSQHLQLPYTLQWNATIEQALGRSQALTVSYVGSHGDRLLQQNAFRNSTNPNAGTFQIVQNGLTSDYDSLQAQFRRRLSKGLTALGSYSWSHCIDYGSENYYITPRRGNCDFDVRHNLSAAFSYDLPNMGHNGFAKAVLSHWGVDNRFTARSAFPVFLQGNLIYDPATAQQIESGENLVSGQPIYLYGANCTSVLQGLGDLAPGKGCPGGRAVNPCALVPVGGSPNQGCPANPTILGLAPRNFVRGFDGVQMNLAVRREFPIHESLKVQFRAEAFNVFNHPNFGDISTNGSNFGQATATLANSLGVLSPLYQMGGPRSMQFALKLLF